MVINNSYCELEIYKKNANLNKSFCFVVYAGKNKIKSCTDLNSIFHCVFYVNFYTYIFFTMT